MKKRTLFLLFLLAALLPLLAVGASASGVTAQGTLQFDNWETGETSTGTWFLDSEGTMTIAGQGVMDSDDGHWPWDDLREEIRTVVLEEGVTDPSYFSFDNCPNLTDVFLPSTLEQITDGASAGPMSFRNCPKLTSFQVVKGNPMLYSQDGILYYRQGNSNGSLYLCPDGKETVDIPSWVTSIGFHALDGCEKLRELTVPASVTTIYGGAFANCTGLKTVTIQGNANVQSYYFWDQFDGCSSLTRIELPSSHPGYATRDGVLYNKDMTNLIVCPSGLTSLTIPASVTEVHSLSQAESLTSLSVAAGNQTFSVRDDLLFDKAGTTLIACPGGLTDVTVPDGTTAIGEDAFAHSANLTRITIPATVTAIGNSAFSETGLTDVFYKGSYSRWNEIEIDYWNRSLEAAVVHLGQADNSGVTACGNLMDLRYGDPVQWSYSSGGSGDIPEISISGPVSDSAPVYVASYETNGRMTDVQMLTQPGSVKVMGGDHAKLFWLDGETGAPKGTFAELPLGKQ